MMKLIDKTWKKILLFLLLFISLGMLEKVIQLNRYPLGMTIVDAIELTNGGEYDYDVSRYALIIDGFSPEELEKQELYYLVNLKTGVYLDFNYNGKLIKKRIYPSVFLPSSFLGINMTPVIVIIENVVEEIEIFFENYR
ncbi:MAG: hypothetical protein J5773_06710 [Verrucomicrobia bacterium]|nr:hypothetical protein [Verrucomicrobiota bacterium]